MPLTCHGRCALTPKRMLSSNLDFATSRRDARQLLVGQAVRGVCATFCSLRGCARLPLGVKCKVLSSLHGTAAAPRPQYLKYNFDRRAVNTLQHRCCKTACLPTYGIGYAPPLRRATRGSDCPSLLLENPRPSDAARRGRRRLPLTPQEPHDLRPQRAHACRRLWWQRGQREWVGRRAAGGGAARRAAC